MGFYYEMANPQPEYYTRFSNELLEAYIHIVRFLSPYENAVWLCVFRKTYGYHKKRDWVSLSQIEIMTGIRQPHVARTKKKLLLKNMIISNNGVGIQKNYEKWYIPKQVYPNRYNKAGDIPKQVLPKQVRTTTQTGNELLPKQVDTKDNVKDTYTKESTNKDLYQDFVFLTKQEHQRLIERFSAEGAGLRITRLNHYLGSTGKKYRSHYYTILNWENRNPLSIKYPVILKHEEVNPEERAKVSKIVHETVEKMKGAT